MDDRIKTVASSSRIPFLILGPVCVFLGMASAWHTTGRIPWFQLFLALFGTFLAHVAVNSLNEYADYKSGLDKTTQRTPFSGGSGALVERPEHLKAVLVTGLGALGGVVLIGLYFLIARGPWILLPGLLGVILSAAYTPWIVRRPWLCLVAPGLGFGVCVVMGTDYALTGDFDATSLFASLLPFFLVSDLLLLNQFPDRDADRKVGRRNLVITRGSRTAARAYGLFLACAFFSVLLGVVVGALPVGALLALIMAPVAFLAFLGTSVHHDRPDKLVPFMALNVVVNLAAPVLMGLGILLS
ncbi:MAG: prenyltransferase [Proteobacteria bacterium]|nr:prenyltransferase [Pseudomonadota bacterium]